VTSDDQAGQTVECPKCGAEQVAPRPKPAASADPPPLQRMKPPTPQAAAAAKGNVFVPNAPKEPKKSRTGLCLGLILTPLAIAVGVVAWPAIRDWLDPRPKTMVEGAAYDYLTALAKGDDAAAAKVGVVQDPPAIRSFRDLKRDKPRDIKT